MIYVWKRKVLLSCRRSESVAVGGGAAPALYLDARAAASVARPASKPHVCSNLHGATRSARRLTIADLTTAQNCLTA